MRKSGANRGADLRIDAAARQAAAAVRQARNEGATERFLNRFLDCLRDVDDAARGLALDYSQDSPGRRRHRG